MHTHTVASSLAHTPMPNASTEGSIPFCCNLLSLASLPPPSLFVWFVSLTKLEETINQQLIHSPILPCDPEPIPLPVWCWDCPDNVILCDRVISCDFAFLLL